MAVNRSMGAQSREDSYFHSAVRRDRSLFQDQQKDDSVLGFNLKLDSISKISNLNERVIEDSLFQLSGYRDVDNDLYWLTLARINELALLCAGNYANNCEFRLAGDLLLNPRLVLIYIRGSLHPVSKIRHMGITEQFRHVADSLLGVVQWLKRETLQEIKEEALLPHFYGLMENSGRMEKRYLDSVMERKTRIASLIGFLASSGFRDGTDFHRWVNRADPADRHLVESMLCRFDHGIFFEMGEDVRLLAEDPTHRSRFLSPRDGNPA
jgi:hypothetical protein